MRSINVSDIVKALMIPVVALALLAPLAMAAPQASADGAYQAAAPVLQEATATVGTGDTGTGTGTDTGTGGTGTTGTGTGTDTGTGAGGTTTGQGGSPAQTAADDGGDFPWWLLLIPLAALLLIPLFMRRNRTEVTEVRRDR
jgi:hypothetical protein